MVALITGASSGIGRDIARVLADRGCKLILVARDEYRLKALAKELNTPVKIIATDLSVEENCKALFDTVKEVDIDLLVNNAGFGVFGKFDKTNLSDELSLISVNITAVHILTKLFLQKFKKVNKGYILNVASSAAFVPGPLMASYYASKAYVLRLSLSVYEELQKDNSNVSISVLCPGPVATNFDKRAGVAFSAPYMSSEEVALKAVAGTLKKQLIIIPSSLIFTGTVLSRFIPTKLLLKICYYLQHRKEE